jgi:hypothetical protein
MASSTWAPILPLFPWLDLLVLPDMFNRESIHSVIPARLWQESLPPSVLPDIYLGYPSFLFMPFSIFQKGTKGDPGLEFPLNAESRGGV